MLAYFFGTLGAWLVGFVLMISYSVRADVILRDILTTNFTAERHSYSVILIIGRISVVAVIKEGRRAELLLTLIVKTWSAACHDSISWTNW